MSYRLKRLTDSLSYAKPLSTMRMFNWSPMPSSGWGGDGGGGWLEIEIEIEATSCFRENDGGSQLGTLHPHYNIVIYSRNSVIMRLRFGFHRFLCMRQLL